MHLTVHVSLYWSSGADPEFICRGGGGGGGGSGTFPSNLAAIAYDY